MANSVIMAAAIIVLALATVTVKADQSQTAPLLTAEMFKEQVLSKSSEGDKMKTDKPWFIKFFAPWCGHCKKVAPIWDEFYAHYGSQFNIASVDCTDNDSKEVCSSIGVRGYPSLILLDGEEMYKYKGQRTVVDFVAFSVNNGYQTIESTNINEIPPPSE